MVELNEQGRALASEVHSCIYEHLTEVCEYIEKEFGGGESGIKDEIWVGLGEIGERFDVLERKLFHVERKIDDVLIQLSVLLRAVSAVEV